MKKTESETYSGNEVTSDVVIQTPGLVTKLGFASCPHWRYWWMIAGIMTLLWSLYSCAEDIGDLKTPVSTSDLLLQYRSVSHAFTKYQQVQ